MHPTSSHRDKVDAKRLVEKEEIIKKPMSEI
jgi:hypothetical protein